MDGNDCPQHTKPVYGSLYATHGQIDEVVNVCRLRARTEIGRYEGPRRRQINHSMRSADGKRRKHRMPFVPLQIFCPHSELPNEGVPQFLPIINTRDIHGSIRCRVPWNGPAPHDRPAGGTDGSRRDGDGSMSNLLRLHCPCRSRELATTRSTSDRLCWLEAQQHSLLWEGGRGEASFITRSLPAPLPLGTQGTRVKDTPRRRDQIHKSQAHQSPYFGGFC